MTTKKVLTPWSYGPSGLRLCHSSGAMENRRLRPRSQTSVPLGISSPGSSYPNFHARDSTHFHHRRLESAVC
jgi:hypothetical protein